MKTHDLTFGGTAFALYFAFAGSISSNETIAGAVSVAVAGGVAFLHRRVGRPVALHAGWIRLSAAVLRSIVEDSIGVGITMVRLVFNGSSGPIGHLADQPFDFGSDEPRQSGRRALVILAISLAPNKFVVASNSGEDRLVVHELVPVKASSNHRWPV